MESEVATTRVDARVTAGVYQSLGLSSRRSADTCLRRRLPASMLPTASRGGPVAVRTCGRLRAQQISLLQHPSKLRRPQSSRDLVVVRYQAPNRESSMHDVRRVRKRHPPQATRVRRRPEPQLVHDRRPHFGPVDDVLVPVQARVAAAIPKQRREALVLVVLVREPRDEPVRGCAARRSDGRRRAR